MTSDPDLKPKRVSTAVKVRRTLLSLLFVATCAFWIYTRFVMVKQPVGGPCSFSIQCREDAPKCLKTSADAEGTCSRACTTDAECASGIACISVGTDEVDSHGRAVEAGYCIPQTVVDALRPNQARARRERDAGNGRVEK